MAGRSGLSAVDFDCGDTLVAGDVEIQFYHRVVSRPIFSVSFNTHFVKDNPYRIFKRDVDAAHLDKDSIHFHPKFKILLHFSETSTAAQEYFGNIDNALEDSRVANLLIDFMEGKGVQQGKKEIGASLNSERTGGLHQRSQRV